MVKYNWVLDPDLLSDIVLTYGFVSRCVCLAGFENETDQHVMLLNMQLGDDVVYPDDLMKIHNEQTDKEKIRGRIEKPGRILC